MIGVHNIDTPVSIPPNTSWTPTTLSQSVRQQTLLSPRDRAPADKFSKTQAKRISASYVSYVAGFSWRSLVISSSNRAGFLLLT